MARFLLMDTLACEATALAEDDLVDLWLELARDVIEHAKTTGEWLASGLRPADKDLADVHRPRSPTALGGRDQRADQRPPTQSNHSRTAAPGGRGSRAWCGLDVTRNGAANRPSSPPSRPKGRRAAAQMTLSARDGLPVRPPRSERVVSWPSARLLGSHVAKVEAMEER